MEDLLKEEEFIETKYDPGKLFTRFYIIAVLQTLLVQTAASFWSIKVSSTLLFNIVVFLIYIFLPPLTLMAMFTRNTEIFSIDRKTKITGVVVLSACYTLTNLVVNLGKGIYSRNSFAKNYMLMQLWSGLLYFVVETFLCLGVVYIVSRLVKKRRKIKRVE